MLDQLGLVALFGSLHSSLPGAVGAFELAGGTPAYARMPLAWNPASTGSKTLSNTPIFDVPPLSTVAFIGLWDALIAGNYQGYIDITDEIYAAQGTYQIQSGTVDLNATPSA